MMMKRVLGVMAVTAMLSALAGCVRWSDAPSVEDCKSGERHARYDHREIRLKSIFGLGESMLADTNRFPMASGENYFSLELEKPIEGFDEACCSFLLENGKSAFRQLTLKRSLDPETADADLGREYRRITQWVADELGIEVESRGLDSVSACRMNQHGGCRGSWPYTYMTIELAEGYEVQVRAREASYVKRDGDYILATQASVEFEILNDGDFQLALRRRRDRHEETEKKIREVSFGPNLTKALSNAMRDEAGLSDPKDKKRRELRRAIKAAESGDVHMMKMLAWEYHYGSDVKSDPKLSFKYSKMAADRGDARGIADLAECYEEGRGTDKNPEKAAELFRRSAQMDNEWAMYRYGKCLLKGIGVETNTAEAVKWFTKACECWNKELEKHGDDPMSKAAIEEELKNLSKALDECGMDSK